MDGENSYLSPREDIRPRKRLRAAGLAVLRAWIAFSVASLVVAIGFATTGEGNLFHSDDSYQVAFIAATCCAIFAFLRGLAKAAGLSRIWQRLAYFGPLVGLATYGVVVDAAFPPAEGQGIPTFFGLLAAASGTACYPLLAVRLTWKRAVCLSIPGLIYFAGFATAVSRMGSPW